MSRGARVGRSRSQRGGAGALGLALALAVVLAACGGGGGDDDESTGRGGGRGTATTTTAAPVPVAPLTGLPDPGGAAQGRPALTVKVDNLDGEGVRPQTGLDQADVVYEEVTEGGITRFAAVFQSQIPEEVGPIRSVRRMDPDLVTPIGGVFAYSGGAGANVDAIRSAPVRSVDESMAGDAMFRSDANEPPHNLFGRGQAFFDGGGDPVPPPALFEYRPEGETATGEPVTAFTVGFMAGYAPRYTWEADSGTWLRDVEGVPFNTATGTQIAPRNVVVQFTVYTGSGGEGQVVGEGDAMVFVDGQLIRCRWVRPDVGTPARYVDGFGGPVKLAPGSTWVELAPVGAPVELVTPPPAPAEPAPAEPAP